MRGRGDRSDALENRERLLSAVERLLARQGAFTLTELALDAGVSRPTAYRNFDSAEDAVTAFVVGRLDTLEAMLRSTGSRNRHLPNGDVPDDISDPGRALAEFRALCLAWGELIEQHGNALVQVRSTEGFLARAHGDDILIGRVYRLVCPYIESLLSSGALPQQSVDEAVFYWNLLLDPREMIDLAAFRGASVREATASLTDDLLKLLQVRGA